MQELLNSHVPLNHIAFQPPHTVLEVLDLVLHLLYLLVVIAAQVLLFLLLQTQNLLKFLNLVIVKQTLFIAHKVGGPFKQIFRHKPGAVRYLLIIWFSEIVEVLFLYRAIIDFKRFYVVTAASAEAKRIASHYLRLNYLQLDLELLAFVFQFLLHFLLLSNCLHQLLVSAIQTVYFLLQS